MKMKRPEPSKPIDSTVMRRLDALERLINDEYSGKPKVFEEKTGVKMAQVGQWFTGYRALRDKALRRLEETTGKPEGWFDAQTISPPLLQNQSQFFPPTVTFEPPPLSALAFELAERFDRLTVKETRLEALNACLALLEARAAQSRPTVLKQSNGADVQRPPENSTG